MLCVARNIFLLIYLQWGQAEKFAESHQKHCIHTTPCLRPQPFFRFLRVPAHRLDLPFRSRRSISRPVIPVWIRYMAYLRTWVVCTSTCTGRKKCTHTLYEILRASATRARTTPSTWMRIFGSVSASVCECEPLQMDAQQFTSISTCTKKVFGPKRTLVAVELGSECVLALWAVRIGPQNGMRDVGIQGCELPR